MQSVPASLPCGGWKRAEEGHRVEVLSTDFPCRFRIVRMPAAPASRAGIEFLALQMTGALHDCQGHKGLRCSA